MTRRNIRSRMAGALASCVTTLLVLGGCRAAPSAMSPSDTATVLAWVTTADRSQLLAPLPLDPAAGAGAHTTIVVDTTALLQPVIGVGAALTDASAIVLQRLPVAAGDRLLRELFSPREGIGLSVLRVPLGASDFSPSHYTLDDAPDGVRDTAFAWFSVARDRDRLRLVKQLRALNPQLTVIAAPWSAPAWMKSNGQLAGGTLREDAVHWYAEYLRRVVTAWHDAGAPIDLLSVQNEPDNATKDYPGMLLSPTQRIALIGHELGPMLARSQPRTRLLEWDHNWDTPASPLAVLADSAARRYVHGVAWHCYAGNVAAQRLVHERHPEVATYFTECAGGAWAPNWGDNFLWNVQTLVIGATREWARGVTLWNLALDSRHGPHLGGCTDCRGVITVDSATGEVTRNEEYYALAHASRFVRPGATRIGSVTAGDTSASVAHVAFRDARDGSHVLLVANAAPTRMFVTITGVAVSGDASEYPRALGRHRSVERTALVQPQSSHASVHVRSLGIQRLVPLVCQPRALRRGDRPARREPAR